MKEVLTVLAGLSFFYSVFSQSSTRDSADSHVYVDLSYGYQMPGGDLEERFGNSSRLSLAFGKKTKSNWTFGSEVYFTFGNTVKENEILDPFKTEAGFILGTTGLPADVFLFQRGFSLYGSAGKILLMAQANANSGIWIKGGIGYNQHRIRIEDRIEEIPLLVGDLKSGYDRLASGFSVMEFVGYRFVDRNSRLNFFGGFEFTQSFNQNRRNYYYDLAEYSPDESRMDLTFGARLGFTLAISKREPDEFYYK